MSRQQFGGDAAAWVVTPVDASALLGAGKTVVGFAGGDLELTFFDGPNGTPLTDLLDATGNPATTVTVPANQPYIPFFQGPDGSQQLWFADVFGAWHLLLPSDSGQRIGGLEDRVQVLESTSGGGGSLDLSSLIVLFIDEVEGGYPARPDGIPVPRFWRGIHKPTVGTDSFGTLYMLDGDMWLHSSVLIVNGG